MSAATGKKRNRKSLSCLICKKRKVKCDKGTPCSTCLKYRLECHYETSLKRPNDSMSDKSLEKDSTYANDVHDELQRLKDKLFLLEHTFKDVNPDAPPKSKSFGVLSNDNPLFGYNPVLSKDDKIDFHQFNWDIRSLKHRSPGPLTWIHLLRMDDALQKLWRYLHDIKKVKKHQIFQIDCKSNEDTETFKRKLDQANLRYNHGDDMIPFKVTSQLPKTSNFIKDSTIARNKINERALALGLMFYEGGIDEELALIDKIELILPKKKVIWKLIARFFSHLYPFLPLLDEDDFRMNISKFIGPESMEDVKVTNLKVEKKMDFTYLGTLLIILRFSYLTYFTNSAAANNANLSTHDPSPKAQETKYLLSNVISIDAIEIAEMCLDQFKLNTTRKFPLLQLALFLKMYSMYSPEDGDTSEDFNSLIFNSTLIQMAFSLGLNRDPTKYYDGKKSITELKHDNLSRKIWHYLLVIDINNAMNTGCHILINPRSFDTKPPFYVEGNANVRNIEIEKMACSTFGKIEYSFGSISEMMDLISDVRTSCDLSLLCSKLEKLELTYLSDYGNLGDHIEKIPGNFEQSFTKVKQIKIYLNANSFLLGLLLHIFNNYERKGITNLANFYMKKIMTIIFREVAPFYLDLLEDNTSLFENSTDLIITPSFQSLVRRCLIIVQSLRVRANFSLSGLESSKDHELNMATNDAYRKYYESLHKLASLGKQSAISLLDNISKISNRYFYAWRITKAGHFINNVLEGQELYNSFDKQLSNLKMPIECMDELSDLMSTYLNNIEQKKSKRKSNVDMNSRENNPNIPVDANNKNSNSSWNNKPGFFDDQNVFNNDQVPTDLALPGTPLMDSAGGAGVYVNNNVYQTPNVPQDLLNNLYNFGNFQTNQEVDDLWLQMMKVKENPLSPANKSTNSSDENRDLANGNAMDSRVDAGWDNSNGSTVLTVATNADTQSFDMLNKLPFEELFSKLL